MNWEILTEYGLTSNEAKIYLSLLELGMTTVTEIAKDSKLHRTNVYDSLKKLVIKGLVTYIKKDNTTYYEAADPLILLRRVKEKEENLKRIIPQLLMAQKFSKKKGEAHIFEGANAFINILYDLLKYDEEILCYGIPKIAPEIMKSKLIHFHKKRINLKIPMKHIYNHGAMERINFLNKMSETYAKYLPESFNSQVSTNVCGGEVIIVLWVKPVMVIQIKNSLIADSYKKYFKLLWSAAKI